MPNVLLSGPAGGGKSAAAKEILDAADEPTVIVDFQTIYAALLGIERDPETGRYPERLGVASLRARNGRVPAPCGDHGGAGDGA